MSGMGMYVEVFVGEENDELIESHKPKLMM